MKKGFSLIELIIVIAILGVLGLCAFVGVERVKQKKKRLELISNIMENKPVEKPSYELIQSLRIGEKIKFRLDGFEVVVLRVETGYIYFTDYGRMSVFVPLDNTVKRN